jgi:hypothetical protein
VGQQPNIELEISDLPRPRPKPDPARAWVPGRPGELGGPEDMKWGAGFGVTGPDAGYAMTLTKSRVMTLADGEHRGNAEAAVAAVAAARSSLYGRAPTKQDIDFALVVLGYDTTDLPTDIVFELGEKRLVWFAAVGHQPGRLTSFLSRIERSVLRLSAAEARAMMARGDHLIAG